MIEISQISKSYQGTKVLDDVTTSIKNSGITSIIGPNGAGKSTLLSIIGRLLVPDDGGYVKVNELDVSTTPSDQLAKCLSVLRQENQFASRLTVEELVGFGRYPYTKGRLNIEDKRKLMSHSLFLIYRIYAIVI